jgi:hypothetical protein
MTPATVERVISQTRLLARRDSTKELPCIDWVLEERRQQLMDLYFAYQDGMAQFDDLIPLVLLLEKKIDANRLLLKWEQEHMLDT